MSRFSDYNSLTKDKLCEIFGQYLIKIHPKECILSYMFFIIKNSSQKRIK